MKEHLKNGNALLAVSVIGLLSLAGIVYTGNSFQERWIENGCDKHWCHQDTNWLTIGAVVAAFIAWLIVLALGGYDILTSKNSKVWKIIWILGIVFLCFAGALLYCLVGRKNRKSG